MEKDLEKFLQVLFHCKVNGERNIQTLLSLDVA
jgi:hypothetical protein